MRLLLIGMTQWMLLLLLLVCIVQIQSSSGTEETTALLLDDDNNDNDNVNEDEILLQETIDQGRGNRDELGVRDQWGATEHLGGKYDIRRPLLSLVQAL